MAIRSKAAAAALALTIASTSEAAEMSDDRQVINVINAVGFYADQNDWDAVAEQFHPEGAVLDYTSYANASAGTSDGLPTLLPQQIVDAWQTVLPGYDRTQHVMGTAIVNVDGTTATALSNIYATHILDNDRGEDFWVFIGDYEHELTKTESGWKITLMRANLRAQLGNPNLPALATAAAKAAAD